MLNLGDDKMDKSELFEALAELSYEDTLEVEQFIKSRKKEFRPFRIKTKFRRCGKKYCYCMDGPSDNEWGNLHGPYLFAQYREGGKTKLKSLGKERDPSDLDYSHLELPKWYHYIVSEEQYEKMSDDRKWETYERSLTREEFVDKYKMSPEEDKIGVPHRLIFDKRKYEADYERYKELSEVSFSKWRKLGIGSPSGIKILDDLIKQGYYFKE